MVTYQKGAVGGVEPVRDFVQECGREADVEHVDAGVWRGGGWRRRASCRCYLRQQALD